MPGYRKEFYDGEEDDFGIIDDDVDDFGIIDDDVDDFEDEEDIVPGASTPPQFPPRSSSNPFSGQRSLEQSQPSSNPSTQPGGERLFNRQRPDTPALSSKNFDQFVASIERRQFATLEFKTVELSEITSLDALMGHLSTLAQQLHQQREQRLNMGMKFDVATSGPDQILKTLKEKMKDKPFTDLAKAQVARLEEVVARNEAALHDLKQSWEFAFIHQYELANNIKLVPSEQDADQRSTHRTERTSESLEALQRLIEKQLPDFPVFEFPLEPMPELDLEKSLGWLAVYVTCLRLVAAPRTSSPFAKDAGEDDVFFTSHDVKRSYELIQAAPDLEISAEDLKEIVPELIAKNTALAERKKSANGIIAVLEETWVAKVLQSMAPGNRSSRMLIGNPRGLNPSLRGMLQGSKGSPTETFNGTEVRDVIAYILHYLEKQLPTLNLTPTAKIPTIPNELELAGDGGMDLKAKISAVVTKLAEVEQYHDKMTALQSWAEYRADTAQHVYTQILWLQNLLTSGTIPPDFISRTEVLLEEMNKQHAAFTDLQLRLDQALREESQSPLLMLQLMAGENPLAAIMLAMMKV